MTTYIYDKHGKQIKDHTTDGYHTSEEVDGFVDGIRDIPRHDRIDYFNAVRIHWNHVHFAGGGDQVNIKPAKDGSVNILTLPQDYGDFIGYEGLDVAPPGVTE